MTNNPTIDGVSRWLIEQSATFLEAHSSGPSIESNLAADLRALLDTPSIIDLDVIDWSAIQQAASESKWIPPEYMRNEWVSDVCEFLRNGAPAVERQEPVTDSTFIRGWEVGSRLFRLRKEANKYIQTGQSEADGNGNKLEPLYRENHAPEVAALQSTIAQLQARIESLKSELADLKGEFS